MSSSFRQTEDRFLFLYVSTYFIIFSRKKEVFSSFFQNFDCFNEYPPDLFQNETSLSLVKYRYRKRKTVLKQKRHTPCGCDTYVTPVPVNKNFDTAEAVRFSHRFRISHISNLDAHIIHHPMFP